MRLFLTITATLFFAAGTIRSLAREEPAAGSAHGPGGAAVAESLPATRPMMSTPEAEVRLPLTARTQASAPHARPASWMNLQANQSLSRVLTGLSIVLGGFLLLAWIARKRMPKGSARLPDEIIEVLGRTTLAAKQSLHLVRVGGKLIVVSVTAAGTETLTEITDPTEVARILAACQQQHSYSSTAAFRQVFDQFGREPASGFIGQTAAASAPSSRGGTRAA